MVIRLMVGDLVLLTIQMWAAEFRRGLHGLKVDPSTGPPATATTLDNTLIVFTTR